MVDAVHLQCNPPCSLDVDVLAQPQLKRQKTLKLILEKVAAKNRCSTFEMTHPHPVDILSKYWWAKTHFMFASSYEGK